MKCLAIDRKRVAAAWEPGSARDLLIYSMHDQEETMKTLFGNAFGSAPMILCQLPSADLEHSPF